MKRGERVAAVKISATFMPLRNFGYRNRTLLPPRAKVTRPGGRNTPLRKAFSTNRKREGVYPLLFPPYKPPGGKSPELSDRPIAYLSLYRKNVENQTGKFTNNAYPPCANRQKPDKVLKNLTKYEKRESLPRRGRLLCSCDAFTTGAPAGRRSGRRRGTPRHGAADSRCRRIA